MQHNSPQNLVAVGFESVHRITRDRNGLAAKLDLFRIGDVGDWNRTKYIRRRDGVGPALVSR